jgi:hypothetical protein
MASAYFDADKGPPTKGLEHAQGVVSVANRIKREHHHANDAVRLRLTTSYGLRRLASIRKVEDLTFWIEHVNSMLPGQRP